MARPQSAPVGEPLPTGLEWHWKIEEIASAHRMKRGAVVAAITRGDLKARKPGKEYQVPDSWYREWIDGSTVQPEGAR